MKKERKYNFFSKYGDMREISERLDKGNYFLSSHDVKLGSIDVKLDKLDELSKLDKLDELSKLDTINNSISGINERLDSLPERIAEAIKK